MAVSTSFTRRETLTAGGVLMAVPSVLLPSTAQSTGTMSPPDDTGVALQVNGEAYELRLDSRARLCSTRCESGSTCSAPKKVAITANAGPALCMLTAAECFPA